MDDPGIAWHTIKLYRGMDDLTSGPFFRGERVNVNQALGGI